MEMPTSCDEFGGMELNDHGGLSWILRVLEGCMFGNLWLSASVFLLLFGAAVMLAG